MAAKKQVNKKEIVNKRRVGESIAPKKTITLKKTIQKRKPAKQEDKRVESASKKSSTDEDMDEDENEEDDREDDTDLEGDDEDESDDAMDLDEGPKQPKKFSSEAFSDAMTKILASTLTGTDKKQPILARSKGLERKIEDEKLDHKARKIMSAEKKSQKEKGRIIPDFTTFDYEKKLRKVATKGVVKLFNAIRIQQKVTEVAVTNAAETRKTKLAIEKAKNVSTMSKSSFLDLLKSGQKS